MPDRQYYVIHDPDCVHYPRPGGGIKKFPSYQSADNSLDFCRDVKGRAGPVLKCHSRPFPIMWTEGTERYIERALRDETLLRGEA